MSCFLEFKTLIDTLKVYLESFSHEFPMNLLAIEPHFRKSYANLSVTIGQDARLICTVIGLGNYKVAWIKVDTQTILSLDSRVITNDPRIRVTHTNHINWVLHISDVRFQDRGYYMCQVNTQPMKSYTIYLDTIETFGVHLHHFILVPPDIIEESTSSDLSIREDTDLNLHCHANGFPIPKVSWQREDGRKIEIFKSSGKRVRVITVFGTMLNIKRVQKNHAGTYLCIASNGVPPQVSKRITVHVNFSPKTSIPNELVAAPLHSKVILACIVEASPTPATSWVRGKNRLIVSTKKYEVTVVHENLKIYMKLLIYDLQKGDFGIYRCIAANDLGQNIGKINLYENRLHPGRQDSRSVDLYMNSDSRYPFYLNVGSHCDRIFNFSNSTWTQSENDQEALSAKPSDFSGSVFCKL
ncbi:Lachesin [Nymphon striatum]|nr:Lachesin [Nymphon striatum]